ncbi:hypothetical protein Taro_005781, partial [Colocasia esculenta]|nr:hypothetical protein [Colocasia esculenta]
SACLPLVKAVDLDPVCSPVFWPVRHLFGKCRGCSAGYASCGSASLALLFPLLPMGCLGWWFFHMAFDAVSCIVATFVAKVPPLLSCFEVELVAPLVRVVFLWCDMAECHVFSMRQHRFSIVWLACASIVQVCVSACASAVLGGTSAGSLCGLLVWVSSGESLSVGLGSFQAVGAAGYCTLSVFPFDVSCGESFLLAALFRPLVHLCCILPGFGACGGTKCSRLSGSPIGGTPGFGRCLCSVVMPWFGLDPFEVDVVLSTFAVVSRSRAIYPVVAASPGGRILVAVWTAVALRWRGFPLVFLQRIELGGGLGGSWWSGEEQGGGGRGVVKALWFLLCEFSRVSCVDTDRCFYRPFLGVIRGGTEGGRACGETVLLTWLLGVSRGDTWLFLPDLVEVWDVGACVVRLWSHVVAPVFRVMLGPTLVVGRGISLFRYFVALCSRCFPLYCFVDYFYFHFVGVPTALAGRDSLSQEFVVGQSWWRLVRRASVGGGTTFRVPGGGPRVGLSRGATAIKPYQDLGFGIRFPEMGTPERPPGIVPAIPLAFRLWGFVSLLPVQLLALEMYLHNCSSCGGSSSRARWGKLSA